MKTKILAAFICAIITLSFYAGNANASIKTVVTDTACCPPDSLKIISTIYPVFCVSWHVRADSGCRVSYGFEVQWRYHPGSNPWNGAIKIYTGGSTVSFCANVDTCRVYQWRVRTICDTLNGGTYSAWVYGGKIAMNCGVARQRAVALLDGSKEQAEKSKISLQAIKPKEQELVSLHAPE